MRRSRRGGHLGMEFGGSGEDSFVAVELHGRMTTPSRPSHGPSASLPGGSMERRRRRREGRLAPSSTVATRILSKTGPTPKIARGRLIGPVSRIPSPADTGFSGTGSSNRVSDLQREVIRPQRPVADEQNPEIQPFTAGRHNRLRGISAPGSRITQWPVMHVVEEQLS